MNRYSISRLREVFHFGLCLIAAALLMALSGCGHGSRDPEVPQAPLALAQSAPLETATTLEEELAELALMQAPEGVDEALFAELKSFLTAELKRRFTGGDIPIAKLTCAPPSGEGNQVDDLSVTDNGDGTYTLTWTYRNLGDYDQDGVVNVMDITPLAAHFNQEAAPENDWVDGNGDGFINIQDLTTLAACFHVSVGRYCLEGASAEEGPFEYFSQVHLEGEPASGRRQLSRDLNGIPFAFIQVVPRDQQGARGEPSNVLALPGEAPVIVGVAPISGETYESITLRAVVTGTERLIYWWDFDGAASPESSPLAEPEVRLASPGDYECSLQVSNAFGEDAFPFEFTVTEPGVSLYAISGRVTEEGAGLGGVQVVLTPGDSAVLTSSDGAFTFSKLLPGTYTLTPSHTDYSLYPSSREVEVEDADVSGQDFAATVLTFSISGIVTLGAVTPFPEVTVTVEPGGITQQTDDDGEFSFAELENGDYTLTPSLYGYDFIPPSAQLTVAGFDWTDVHFTGQMISWEITTIDPGPSSGLANNLRMVDGRPAISYFEIGIAATGDLKLAINSEADGSGEWTTSLIVADVLQAHSLAVIDGNPAVCYYTSVGFAPDPLHFARNANPDGSGAWTSHSVISDVEIGVGVSLCEIAGRPAIAYYRVVDATTASLRFTICSNSDGSGSWTVPATVVDAAGHVGTYPFLAVLNTIPAVAYYDLTNRALKLALNDAVDASGNWDIQVPYNIGSVGAFPSMTMVDGRPAISFLDSGGKSLKYIINSEADASGDWRKVTVDYKGSVGSYCSLAVIGGYPAISYYDTTNRSLKYAQAMTADGLDPEAWICWTVDTEDDVGTYTSLLEVDSRPAVAYRDNTSGALKFAIRPF